MRFQEAHPEALNYLWTDLDAGKFSVERRHTEDIERLLNSPWYRVAATLLPVLWTPVYWFRAGLRRIARILLKKQAA